MNPYSYLGGMIDFLKTNSHLEPKKDRWGGKQKLRFGSWRKPKGITTKHKMAIKKARRIREYRAKMAGVRLG